MFHNATVFAILIGAAGVAYGQQYGKEKALAVYFPPIKLDSANYERVSGISLFIKCGEIRALRHVPPDWSFQSRGPISREVEFHAGAGHGATWLWSIDQWNGSIAVAPTDQACFDISAKIFTDGQVDEKNQEITLSRKQLKLRP
jgi:hypothetical protein